MTDSATLCSNEGLEEINSEADCQLAAETLGMKWGDSWNGTNKYPKCLYSEDGRWPKDGRVETIGPNVNVFPVGEMWVAFLGWFGIQYLHILLSKHTRQLSPLERDVEEAPLDSV